MAYANVEYYTSTYGGDVITSDKVQKWLERASDELDRFTFGRLMSVDTFPVEEAHIGKIKKAVCAIADALYQIDFQRQASAAQKAEDGTFHGTVASISSGRETISYSTPSAAASASIYATAAANETQETELIGSIVSKYLANIPDRTGVNLLYAGVCRYV